MNKSTRSTLGVAASLAIGLFSSLDAQATPPTVQVTTPGGTPTSVSVNNGQTNVSFGERPAGIVIGKLNPAINIVDYEGKAATIAANKAIDTINANLIDAMTGQTNTRLTAMLTAANAQISVLMRDLNDRRTKAAAEEKASLDAKLAELDTVKQRLQDLESGKTMPAFLGQQPQQTQIVFGEITAPNPWDQVLRGQGPTVNLGSPTSPTNYAGVWQSALAGVRGSGGVQPSDLFTPAVTEVSLNVPVMVDYKNGEYQITSTSGPLAGDGVVWVYVGPLSLEDQDTGAKNIVQKWLASQGNQTWIVHMLASSIKLGYNVANFYQNEKAFEVQYPQLIVRSRKPAVTIVGSTTTTAGLPSRSSSGSSGPNVLPPPSEGGTATTTASNGERVEIYIKTPPAAAPTN